MKIAIHHRSGSFSDRWIEYCKNKSIEYKIVNAYDSDIVEQVADCDAFMWHHHQSDYRDVLFANQLLYSLEARGVKCFPDFRTTWHFDDKVGQKYLLESIGAPLVPSYVFYTKKETMEWIQRTTFPKVFKLRGGASAANVFLVHNKEEAKKIAKIAFGKGFTDKSANLKERFRKYREGKEPLSYLLKGIGRVFIKTDFAKMHGREKGYAYFQDFIVNNYFDIRVIVVGDKAFAIKHKVLKNDFRAFGSGNILYNRDEIPEVCVKVSFEVSKKLKAQFLAYDYVFGADRELSIVEISYGFVMHGYDTCPGYWTDDMVWHERQFNPQEWMPQDIVGQVLTNESESRAGDGNVLINKYLHCVFEKYGITVSNKKFDLRVVVIGDKAMGEKRYARKGDFRASGSGEFEYVPLREDVLRVAFSTAQKLQMQSVAFDFIFCDNIPMIVEISYAFGTHGISHCKGYYSSDFQWHFSPEPNLWGWMVEDLMKLK